MQSWCVQLSNCINQSHALVNLTHLLCSCFLLIFVAAPNHEEPKMSVLASDTVACHRKRSFDVAFKQIIIQFAESNSKAAVARAINVDQKCVQT